MFVWDCKSDIQLSVMVLLSSTAFCQGLGSIHNLSTFFRLKQRTLYEKRFITRSFLTQSSLVTSGKKSGQVFFFFLFQTCELFLLTILTLISEFWKKKKHKTCPLFFLSSGTNSLPQPMRSHISCWLSRCLLQLQTGTYSQGNLESWMVLCIYIQLECYANWYLPPKQVFKSKTSDKLLS